jgi:tRNA nucleotidyltransferase/poly(A) polymerase
MSGKKITTSKKLAAAISRDKELAQVGRAADTFHVSAFLVGGAVRDLFLGKKNYDKDIVIEGDPDPLVRWLAGKWAAHVMAYPEFGTYVLKRAQKHHVDFATARKESYPRPGCLPRVVPSTLTEDLFRRDFTINALALPLNGPNKGTMVDAYGGCGDLRKKVLRVLHRKSFRDDPTRIFRLARFAGRGFRIDKATAILAAQGKKYLSSVTDERYREEILAILSEKDPFPGLKFLERWGVLKHILPGVKVDEGKKKLKKLPSLAQRIQCLLSGLMPKSYQKALERLKLPRSVKKDIEKLTKREIRKPVLSGHDLIKMVYCPGPIFKEILNQLMPKRFASRREAKRFVFDNFPQNI